MNRETSTFEDEEDSGRNKAAKKWVTRFRNVATRKKKERKIKLKEKTSASKVAQTWFERRLVEPLRSSRLAQLLPFLRQEPTTGERELRVHDRQYNSQFNYKWNNISTTKYGPITFVPKNLFEVSTSSFSLASGAAGRLYVTTFLQ